MEPGHYERLSGLDNSFLLLESRTTYMHIAVTAVFEPGSLVGPGGGLDVARLRTYIAARLERIPRYRQRLAHIPMLREPVWIDDDTFELNYHVRHSSLPKPGGDAELRGLCARILERQLDRGRPLWELWFIEGLDGGRFAMLAKVHHCMVDGIGGIDLLAALLAPEPESPRAPADPRSWSPRPAPTEAQLIRNEAMRRVRSTVNALRSAASSLRDGSIAPDALRERATAFGRLLRDGVSRRPALPFNRTIGPHRRVAWFSFALDDVRSVKERLGGTLNDVVLATVAGALRRFLATRGVHFDAAANVRAAVPVSVRRPEASGSSGNSVSAWIVPLPLGESDAWRRLTAIRTATAGFRQSGLADGMRALTEAAELAGSNLLGLTLRMAGKVRPYDLVVTNVPGPPMRFYLMDAPMVAAYPHLPLFEGQGLGIALLSYDGTLSWGLTGDWQLLPDLDDLAAALEKSFADLARTAHLVAAAARTRSEPAEATVGACLPFAGGALIAGR